MIIKNEKNKKKKIIFKVITDINKTKKTASEKSNIYFDLIHI